MKEINFDGLVGPTHHYGGLAYGNLASMRYAQHVSNPKLAALQGLNKMKRVMERGIPQAVLPPPMRPSIAHLHSFGFRGEDQEVLAHAAKEAPALLRLVSSASAMWRANSATVTPSCDSFDGKVHITIANLHSQLHRRIEVEETEALFRLLFPEFTIHSPLPFDDEGAANHIRFCSSYDQKGVHLFVYGENQGQKFPARQSRAASEAIARRHGAVAVFAEQNPRVIERGVFHNDVISVGNRNVFFYHSEAFVDTDEVIAQIEHYCPLNKVCVDISVEKAVETYLFNSQLLTLPDGSPLLLAPEECRDLSIPLPVEFIDVRQSMHNGGGPACLRLAMPLTEAEQQSVHQGIFLTEELYSKLTAWVEKHYRDRFHPDDVADPALLGEVQTALDELTHLLRLGAFYGFQRISARA